MPFRDIKGQDRQITFLKSAIENDSLAHAYIFFGPSGIGKKKAALNFAKALKGDAFIVSPDKEGSSLGIDVIRSIIRDINLTPYEAQKVYIIDDADLLTQEASNALLKTLEEPPGDAILILIARDKERLLPTIISRCQALSFYPLMADDIKKILIESFKMDEARAQLLAGISSGSIGRALEIENEGFYDKRSRMIDQLINGTFFDSDYDNVKRPDLKLYLEIMLAWYRDILVAKAAGSEAALINVDKRDAIEAEARGMEFGRLEGIIKQIILTNSFLDQNANIKLAMSVLALGAEYV